MSDRLKPKVRDLVPGEIVISKFRPIVMHFTVSHVKLCSCLYAEGTLIYRRPLVLVSLGPDVQRILRPGGWAGCTAAFDPLHLIDIPQVDKCKCRSTVLVDYAWEESGRGLSPNESQRSVFLPASQK